MQLAPNTRPIPMTIVVAVEAAEMQYDSIETSELSDFSARFSVHHLFLKPLPTGISEKLNHLSVARLRHSAAKVDRIIGKNCPGDGGEDRDFRT